jgi:hypothetical protein
VQKLALHDKMVGLVETMLKLHQELPDEWWRHRDVTMNGECGMTRREKKRHVVQASPDLPSYWKS